MPSPLESVELEATSYFPQVPSIRSFGTVRRTSPRETFRWYSVFRRHKTETGITIPNTLPLTAAPHDFAGRISRSKWKPRDSLGGRHGLSRHALLHLADVDFRIYHQASGPTRANSPHDSHPSDTVPTTAQTDVQPSSPPLPASSDRILGPPTHYAPNSDHTVSDQVFLRGGGLPSAHHFRATLPARRSTISAATTTPRAGAAAATALHSAHARRPRYVLTPQRAIDDEQENSGAAEERAMLEELRQRERALGIGGGPVAGAGGAAAGGDDALGVMDETPPREGRFARIARGG
ncbi:hypothetical protein H2201_002160 [Coniosporium apollinis]|uniref:Uncharacterized protein n=1 Tax=Coniosporium apollinis TaxID=61459 RepID=A0ABQ9NZ25_9PEZI|nr:hypothetical protein H2201_002160 [Coniosporium apollinis]